MDILKKEVSLIMSVPFFSTVMLHFFQKYRFIEEDSLFWIIVLVKLSFPKFITLSQSLSID